MFKLNEIKYFDINNQMGYIKPNLTIKISNEDEQDDVLIGDQIGYYYPIRENRCSIIWYVLSGMCCCCLLLMGLILLIGSKRDQ